MPQHSIIIKSLILLLVLILAIPSCNINSNLNNNSNHPNNAEPGSCHAKCKISQSKTIEALVYTGINTEDPSIKLVTDIITPKGGTKWVKKKADKNCLSRDPNDCLVWCLMETPEETVTYYTVIDTSTNKEFEYRNLMADNIAPNYVTEWRRVVCADRVSSIIPEVQFFLFDHDYDITEPFSNQMDVETKSALFLFQEQNNLPIGNLNYETLNFMGIATP